MNDVKSARDSRLTAMQVGTTTHVVADVEVTDVTVADIAVTEGSAIAEAAKHASRTRKSAIASQARR